MEHQDMNTQRSRTRATVAVATAVLSLAAVFGLAGSPASAAAVAPLSPTITSVTIPAGTKNLLVKWDANPAGEPATSFVINFIPSPVVYDIYGVAVGLVQVVVPAPANTYTWSDGESGKTYQVNITAVNAYGSSPEFIGPAVGPLPVLPAPPCTPPNCPPPLLTNPERPFAPGRWEDVIKRTYKEFANRAPKLDELTFWRYYITQGSPSNAVLEDRRLDFVTQLAEDAEQTDGPSFRLYTAYFGRNPEVGGFKFWSKKLRSGSDLLGVSNFFANSSEFKNTYGSIDEAEFVALIYKNVLARTPDGSGFSFWTRQLQSGRYSRAEVMIGFSESQEYKGRLAKRVGAGVAFSHMLNRMPTDGEYFLADIGGFGFPTSPVLGPFGNLYFRLIDTVEYRSLGVTP